MRHYTGSQMRFKSRYFGRLFTLRPGMFNFAEGTLIRLLGFGLSTLLRVSDIINGAIMGCSRDCLAHVPTVLLGIRWVICHLRIVMRLYR